MALAGTTAIVTGSDSGIGQAIAAELAVAGADVCVTYHSDEDGAKETRGMVEAAGRRQVPARRAVGLRETRDRRSDGAVAQGGMYPGLELAHVDVEVAVRDQGQVPQRLGGDPRHGGVGPGVGLPGAVADAYGGLERQLRGGDPVVPVALAVEEGRGGPGQPPGMVVEAGATLDDALGEAALVFRGAKAVPGHRLSGEQEHLVPVLDAERPPDGEGARRILLTAALVDKVVGRGAGNDEFGRVRPAREQRLGVALAPQADLIDVAAPGDRGAARAWRGGA